MSNMCCRNQCCYPSNCCRNNYCGGYGGGYGCGGGFGGGYGCGGGFGLPLLFLLFFCCW